MTAHYARPGVTAGTGANSMSSGPPEPDERSAASEFVTAVRRRRAAAWRCPPVDGDAPHRDPLRYRARPPDRREVLAWDAAVEHLAGHGRDVAWVVPAAVRAAAGDQDDDGGRAA